MRLLIISNVIHNFYDGKIYGYRPYIREMNLWTKYADQVTVVANRKDEIELNPIDSHYTHPNFKFVEVPSFNILNGINIFKTLLVSPKILVTLFKQIKKADHVHFRCPSNLSLLGLFVQVFFPKKLKSAKYAGNWDPKSKQPWTYRLQQTILRNTIITKNIKVLVYGEWPNETKNIQPFISATYNENEKVSLVKRDYSQTLDFVFAGALVVGKRPLLTIQIIEVLNKNGIKSRLHMYGDGILKSDLEKYIIKNNLRDQVILYGNCSIEEIKKTLTKSHFNILPSKSEGWPKAVAEGMFFGCIPIATNVSCVSWMLNYGKRGVVIEPDLEKAVSKIKNALKNENLNDMALAAMQWSQQYTFDRLENDIKKVLED